MGDLGPEAHRFADALAAAGQGVWQVLPLCPTSVWHSPYDSPSALAGNPLLISPELLVEDGLLAPSDWEHRPEWRLLARRPADGRTGRTAAGRGHGGPGGAAHPGAAAGDRVDYATAWSLKRSLLALAWSRFATGGQRAAQDEFRAFCAAQGAWLHAHARFSALAEVHGHTRWWDWAGRPGAPDRPLELAALEVADRCAHHAFVQYLFERQWQRLRAHARARGLLFFGDMPIYVGHESAELWRYPQLFKLGPDGQLLARAGVPPDAFSATGQLWGNPIYDWAAMERDGYAFWIERLGRAEVLFDVVRLDHFRAFEAYWEVPREAATAAEGSWQPGPGDRLFQAVHHALGPLPLIAEDLGIITPEVDALRKRWQLPGMRVLQFGFDGDPDNPHALANCGPDSVVYTGTHDHDTLLGWWQSLDAAGRHLVLAALPRDLVPETEADLPWALIEVAESSPGCWTILPVQDVLALGSGARMNVPGTVEGNWTWRLPAGAFGREHQQRLRELAATHGRLPA